jgi:hypothetical protein
MGIFLHVVPEGQLVRTYAPSTHCANCPLIQSTVPAAQTSDEDDAVVVATETGMISDVRFSVGVVWSFEIVLRLVMLDERIRCDTVLLDCQGSSHSMRYSFDSHRFESC